MSEALTPYEPQVPHYLLQNDEASGGRTATIRIGEAWYSVVVPLELDASAILADKRRSSRASWLEELLSGPHAEKALVNRTVQLVAFDAFEAGEIPQEAWDEFRVATTLVHDELLRASHEPQSLGNFTLHQIEDSKS